MKDQIIKTKNRAVKFAEDHKVGIAVTATAAVCVALNRLALKDHDNFLKEKGLYDEFYTPSDDEV